MEIEADASPEMVERLRGYFEMEDWQVYRTDGPVNLSRLFHFYDETQRPDLKFPRGARTAVESQITRHL